MGLTSEHVHWIFGAALIAVASLQIWRAHGKLTSRWLDFVVPLALVLFGLEMALDPLVHGAAKPGGYGAESAQHLVLGLILILGAAVEVVRVRKGLMTLAWRMPLILAVLIAAGLFAFHAQHDADAPMLLLMTQHRVIAATLLAAALALLISPLDGPDAGPRPVAFPLIILILGAQFLLYTEGRTIFSPADQMPARHSAGARH
ncbi:hypothetical protein [Phenylobacterium sp. 58.2.17]|uniref:hypothetical protein n=1 Tax=Phenylobacterium sp. 58.2.17 TaxID=2969306 RepID=UPI0022642E76|nr:hypothetical protein [Phenylobacterium sp. 58.2.17]MCX7587301.1 hypothetical protein [Phenylobacterium sp. 58.2.17]